VDVDTPAAAAPAHQPRRAQARQAAARQPAPQKQAQAAAAAPAGGGGGGAAAPARTTESDADGLGTTRSYDMTHIRSVLDRESRTLFPCIRDEVRRSGYSGNIPFAFVINNDGRVGRLWIDERRLRGGEMQQCFEQVMARWRFNAFPGERPTVNHSFTVGG
jgi:outer membrane biosynthesis protein TonB